MAHASSMKISTIVVIDWCGTAQAQVQQQHSHDVLNDVMLTGSCTSQP